jgi:predicted site-specific integrase-resolvase
MDFLTARQTAEKWGLSLRQVQSLLKAGRIPGAIQPARDWLIPKDAKKPTDERRNNRRQPKKETVSQNGASGDLHNKKI